MAKTSTITEAIVSFYLTDKHGSSFIDFGTPNPAAMRGGDISKIVYIDTEQDAYKW
jgi:hypothetical protein